MKKIKNIKLMLIGLFAMVGMNAFAQEPLTDGTLKFIDNGDGKTATIKGFAAGKAAEDLVIPDEIVNLANGQKFKVTAVEDKAFLDAKDKVKTIDLKATKVTTITKDLFSNLSNLESIKLGAAIEDIKDGAFVGTKLKELDLSKTSVKTIGNYFGTYCSFKGTYDKKTANAKNVETIKKAGGTPVAAGDVKTPAGKSTPTKFENYAQINEYYKATYKLNADYPGAITYGEYVPYTKETANADNVTDFATQGCVKADMNVKWTLETALAWNVAYVKNAMYEGYVLDEITAPVYNTATGGTKKAEDVLTAEEAQAYNEKIASPTYSKTFTGADYATDKVAIVGNNSFDEDGNFILYTTETAYAYNLSIVAACHKVGEIPATPTTLASQYDYLVWNNNNVVTPQGGTVLWPGDDNPGSVEDIPAVLYDDDTAYDQNVILAGTKAVKDGDVMAEPCAPAPNKTLTSVKLNSAWTVVNAGAFENCQALVTVDFGKAAKDLSEQPQSIGDRAFLGTALTAFDFVGTNVTTLTSDLFVDFDKSYTKDAAKNATLTSVTFNKVFAAVPAGIFADCTALATVEFEERDILTPSAPGAPAVYEVPFGLVAGAGSAIGANAFRNTAIKSIVIPEALDAGKAGNYQAIDELAFYGCNNLKSFTYMVDNETSGVVAVVHDLAFPGCKDVIYYTTNANVSAYKYYDKPAPKNTKFSIASSTGYVTPFVTTEFKKVPGKYYIKYRAAADIRVKKDEAKVYDAYLDDTDFTLNMTLYKASAGYYNIAAGDVVLILTNKKDLEFETASGITSGSFNGGLNALDITMEETPRATLDYLAGLIDPSCVIYGWVNSAKAGTGFQKITTGDVFPQGTLFILAAEPSEGARLQVVWRDENGNVTGDPTAIESVINVEEVQNDEIFNLQGIRVNKAKKGLYIINGKKVVK